MRKIFNSKSPPEGRACANSRRDFWATKTSGAAKVYRKRLNSKKKVSVLKWASESEYFQR